jgi:hypothetical protein
MPLGNRNQESLHKLNKIMSTSNLANSEYIPLTHLFVEGQIYPKTKS